jgi:hypothetical protein
MIALAIASALAATAPAAAREAPLAKALWSISSSDCVSVHADGEPWDECGFQSYAINHDGSRVLTVSATGVVQLWDGAGREMRRIDRPDHRSGASGYPSGEAVISGNTGVAVAHHNQITVLDLESGTVLSESVAEDLMVLEELRFEGDRLFAKVNDREWALGIREIALPGGEIRTVPSSSDWSAVQGTGPAVWLTGTKPPFKLHSRPPSGMAPHKVWTCVPAEGRFCFRRDTGGRYLHAVDVSKGGETLSVDTGRALTDFDIPYFAVAAGHPMAVLCGRAPLSLELRDCRVFDFVSGKGVHDFKNVNLRAFGAADEEGRPEIRLALYQGDNRREHRRVGLDGRMRVVDPSGRSNLLAPGGGVILPLDESSSLLVDSRGKAAARLPFPSQSCGDGWPGWAENCRFSGDGRRWLLPLRPREEKEKRGGLTLYEVPVAGD